MDLTLLPLHSIRRAAAVTAAKRRPATPEMVQRQSELLTKYFQAGVIHEETYRKAQASVDATPTRYSRESPDSQPAEEQEEGS